MLKLQHTVIYSVHSLISTFISVIIVYLNNFWNTSFLMFFKNNYIWEEIPSKYQCIKIFRDLSFQWMVQTELYHQFGDGKVACSSYKCKINYVFLKFLKIVISRIYKSRIKTYLHDILKITCKYLIVFSVVTKTL